MRVNGSEFDLVDPHLTLKATQLGLIIETVLEGRWVELARADMDASIGIGLVANGLEVSFIFSDASTFVERIEVKPTALLSETPERLANEIPALIELAVPLLLESVPSLSLAFIPELVQSGLSIRGIRGEGPPSGERNLVVYLDRN